MLIIDPIVIKKNMLRAEISFVTWAFLIASVSPTLTALRLNLILRLGHVKTSYTTCIRAMLCGSALNLFLPGRGGDLAKVGFLRSDKIVSWGTLTGIILVERTLDILALAIIGFITSVALGHKIAAIVSGGVAILAIIGFVLLPKLESLPLVGQKCKALGEVASKVGKKKIRLAFCFIICCLCWSVNAIILGLLLKAFDDSISLIHSFSVAPPSILVGIVPISLWGVGTRDGALAYFLQDYTLTENVISAGFLYTALVYWLLGLIGLPALFFAKRNAEKFPK